MEPIRFEITLTDEVFASRAGLALIGRLVSRTDLRRRFDALTVAGVSSPTISHGEVALSMLGLLCLARPDYAAVEDEEPGELLQLGLGLDALPSEETLRQRLDQMGASSIFPGVHLVHSTSEDQSAKLPSASSLVQLVPSGVNDAPPPFCPPLEVSTSGASKL